MAKQTLILCILDGWGISKEKHSNAIALAKTPNFDNLIQKYPSCALRADGKHVGLSENQVGNSEVGHMTIGSGRKVQMSLPKINAGIRDGTLIQKEAIQNFVISLKKSGGAAHLMGLVSEGGVHAHKDHMLYLANYLAAQDIAVKLHCFLDGRDAPPKSALNIISALEENLSDGIQIVSLIGRSYAMDRDKRWERVEKCYNLLVEGKGEKFDNPTQAINSKYEAGDTDEFIGPIVLADYKGISENSDGLFFLNYRADRAKEIMEALFAPTFEKFKRKRKLSLAAVCGLVEYEESFKGVIESVYRPQNIKNTLGEWLSVHRKKQLRLAETEKYPHVTYFFNGGVEQLNDGETRLMVSSPKVKTYDHKPDMSAFELTDNLVEAIEMQKYDFILANYANPDMVGHTGDLRATITACEVVDNCLGRVLESVKQFNVIFLITSDHGNCELMYDNSNDAPHTAHTLNPVPFIAVGLKSSVLLRNGGLSDIAPTVIQLLNLYKPNEMTGESLVSS